MQLTLCYTKIVYMQLCHIWRAIWNSHRSFVHPTNCSKVVQWDAWKCKCATTKLI